MDSTLRRLACLAALAGLCTLATLAACGDDGATTTPADLALPDLAPPEAVPARVTALHYDVTFDLPTRVARTAVTLRIDAPGNGVTLGFRIGEASNVTVDGVAVGLDDMYLDDPKGPKTLTVFRPGHALWSAGEKTVLAVTATVPKTTISSSQVGYSVKNDLTGKPFSYLVSWVNGCDHHGLCDAAPDRFATYKFTVTGDAADQVLCPGTVTTAAGKTTCDFAFEGGPTYSTYGIAAGRSWTPRSLGSWDGVEVTLYDYPQTKIGDAIDTRVQADHMAWLQSLLGPFPYGKSLRLVIGPTYWLGFEHPGNIVLAQTLELSKGQIPYPNPLRHVLMHEITHQWAGDHKTLAGTYDFFWKEATAEYLAYVYEEEKVSADDGKAVLDYWKNAASASRYYPVPEDSPRPELFTYYSDAYGEGPMVLYRQLEVMYGRDKVLAAAKQLLSSTSPPRALAVDDFRAALEAATGAKLTGYFNGWMKGAGTPAWPTAKVTLTPMAGTQVQVAVDVKTADNVPRGCAFTVRLHDAGNRTFDVPVNLGPDGAAFNPVVVDPGFANPTVEIDPKTECLIFPRSGPRKPRPPVEPWVAPQL